MLTLAHDLIDLSILLATDKLLVFVCQLNFYTHLIRGAFDEWNLVDHHHCRFDSIVRAVDGESQLIKADISARISTNVGQHSADV